MTAERQKFVLLVLLVFAAVVRLAFYLELKGTDLAAVPLLDCQNYHDWAARLVAGDWDWYKAYWMGPLYPHLLAIVYVVFGVGSQAALVLQLILSWFNLVLLYRLTHELLADERWAGEAALSATALFGFYGAPVFYAGNLLMATLVSTLFLIVARQTVRAVKEPTAGSWFVLGITVGLAGLARGNILLLLPVLPILLWRAASPAAGTRGRLIGALFLGGILLLTPVALRNLVVADDFVVLTSNGGVNLLIGQQADYKGMFAPVMDESQADFDPSMERPLERELGRDLKGSEVSRILTRRAWHTFRDNLSAMPLHYARKIYRFWNGYELPQIVSYNYYHHWFKSLRALPLPFFVLSGLGLAGLWLLPSRPRWILLVLLGGYFFSLLPFFPTSRYRQPLAPLLAISAATWLLTIWRQPQRRRAWLPIGLLMMIILLPRWASLSQAEVRWQVHLNAAARASKRGNLTRTQTEGNQAEAARPGLADTPYQLSLCLEDLGAHEPAIAQLAVAAERAPRNRLVPYQTGRNYEEMGDARRAVAAYEKAASLDPSWSSPWLRGGLVLNAEGRRNEALRAFEQAYKLAPGNRRIRANLASAYAESGNTAKAHQLLVSLTHDYPLYVNGWFNRALLEYQTGLRGQAQTSLAAAKALRSLTAAEREQISQLARLIEESDHS